LAKTLTITLPKKSTIITVSYHSKDRRLAEAVLTALSKFYPEKHLAARRPRGQFEFFDQQADRARQSLSEVQKKLSDSARNSANFAGQAQLDLTVQKLTEQRAALEQTYTAIRETEKRMSALESQLKSTPARMATEVRTADNPELIAQLKATQLQLELKRTELLHKFKPTYRAVQEVDQQLAQTRAAITAAESTPVTDRTTNSDPTYEWIRSELAKAHTELISLQVRAGSLARYTNEYTDRARRLSEGNLQQQQLLTTAKALEETYQLYLRKREEARISDALDRSKILNVSLAQLPSLPVLPMHSSITIAGGALFFALLLSVGTGFASEYLDNSLRSPNEVQAYLGIPVIAALPSGDIEAGADRRSMAEL
jgi:uncharacterized protein involved in exopolysaccharide biosynthesis